MEHEKTIEESGCNATEEQLEHARTVFYNCADKVPRFDRLVAEFIATRQSYSKFDTAIKKLVMSIFDCIPCH
jgi:hypothetical protein